MQNLFKAYSCTLVATIQDIKIGDHILFFCPCERREVEARIIGFPNQNSPDLVLYEFDQGARVGILNILELRVYKTTQVASTNLREGCSCGAKHTSNPAFHLSYCPKTTLKPEKLD